MNENMQITIISGFISLFTALIVGLITYYTTFRKYKKDFEYQTRLLKYKDHDTLKYKYILPFKYISIEFQRRLFHIEKIMAIKLGENNENETTTVNFRKNFKTTELSWYFNDGYFITSTLYMNCIFFYWTSLLQKRYPYIQLSIKKNYINNEKSEQIQRCIKSVSFNYNKLNEEYDLFYLLTKARLAIARYGGIPYSLHDSFGDFVYNREDDKIINYEEFSKQLLSDNSRIKYIPMIKFWRNINHSDKLNKIRELILILDYFNNSKIIEQ